MKRFLIPAFFVIDVEDNENISHAQEIAAEMQNASNVMGKRAYPASFQRILLLDEEVLDREVPIIPEETELPHTFNWQPPNAGCDACGTNDRKTGSNFCKECAAEIAAEIAEISAELATE